MTRANKEKYGTRSGFEGDILKALDDKNIPFGYETEVIKYTPPAKQRKYTPDVVLTKKNGDTMYIEAKGRFLTADRMKHLAVRQSNPLLDIRFVFQNPNLRIYKGSLTTYADWCNANNFEWAGGTIPQQWLDECK